MNFIKFITFINQWINFDKFRILNIWLAGNKSNNHGNNEICMIHKRGAAWRYSFHRVFHLSLSLTHRLACSSRWFCVSCVFDWRLKLHVYVYIYTMLIRTVLNHLIDQSQQLFTCTELLLLFNSSKCAIINGSRHGMSSS